MPIFDYACTHCSIVHERLVWPSERDDVQRCTCGSDMRQVFTGRAPSMVPDSIPGGMVLENLTKTPQRFYSRTEIKDAMRAANVEQKVRHVGEPGSDKSRYTSRWV